MYASPDLFRKILIVIFFVLYLFFQSICSMEKAKKVSCENRTLVFVVWAKVLADRP